MAKMRRLKIKGLNLTKEQLERFYADLEKQMEDRILVFKLSKADQKRFKENMIDAFRERVLELESGFDRSMILPFQKESKESEIIRSAFSREEIARRADLYRAYYAKLEAEEKEKEEGKRAE